MKKQRIHSSIKECLGYDAGISDIDFLKDLKYRSTRVCKPCWELKYCPYGPFVEQSPLLPPLRAESQKHHDYLLACLQTGLVGEYGPLSDEQRASFEDLLELSVVDPYAFAQYVKHSRMDKKVLEELLKEASSVEELLSSQGRAPIQFYKPSFPFYVDKKPSKAALPPDLAREVETEIIRISEILATSFLDNRRHLDDKRRKSFEESVRGFRPDALPESIPDAVTDMACNIFGHICPVMYVSKNISETSDSRRRGRYIPFTVKMRVVRRDNYTCQECRCHLRDDEVEFDHIIPYSKGGSSEEQNIRLTCYDCNREKRDSVEI